MHLGLFLAVLPAAPLLGPLLAPVQGPAFTPFETQLFPSTESSFGDEVALSGDTALVASWMSSEATVLRRTGSTWAPEGVLGGWPAQMQGATLALDGDTAAVGLPEADGTIGLSPGAVHIYVRSGSSWNLQAVLSASNGVPYDRLGHSVALDGDTLLAGAPTSADGRGTVYAFTRQGTTWQESAILVPGAAPVGAPSDELFFGSTVALQGDRAAIASPFDALDGLPFGQVTIFERTGGVWGESGVIANPGDPVGVPPEKLFGAGLDLDGDRLLIGDRGIYGGIGSAYLYGLGSTGWESLLAFHSTTLDAFGSEVGIDGDRLAISAPSTGQLGAGEVRFFDAATGARLATASAVSGANVVGFGTSLAIDGGTALVGSGQLPSMTGAAHVLELIDDPVTYCTAGVSASGCSASIAATGVASASAGAGFDLLATGVEGQKDGLFFFGGNGRQANPWGNGTSFQCVAPPVSRAGVLPGVGTPGACDGSFTQDLNALWCAGCPGANKNPGAGAVLQVQLWFRDPLNPSNQTTSLSNALELHVAP